MNPIKVALLAGILALTGGNSANWNTTVVESNQGHVIGNPEAENTLTEYISYTCPHCAEFANKGDPVIKLTLIHPGELKLEVRHLLRDPIDLAAAMLTHCGDASKFPLNHAAFMYTQERWLDVARKANPAQMRRWTGADRAASRRAIASDLGFYDLMAGRGYDRVTIDRCLSDEVKANAMAKTSAEDTQRLGLKGTPSFVLNGELLEGVHSWAALEPHLTGKAASVTDR